jgi:hypothetical protein
MFQLEISTPQGSIMSEEISSQEEIITIIKDGLESGKMTLMNDMGDVVLITKGMMDSSVFFIKRV